MSYLQTESRLIRSHQSGNLPPLSFSLLLFPLSLPPTRLPLPPPFSLADDGVLWHWMEWILECLLSLQPDVRTRSLSDREKTKDTNKKESELSAYFLVYSRDNKIEKTSLQWN
jgi:hypothetical protein